MIFFIIFLLFLVFQDRVSLCTPEDHASLKTHRDPPISASGVLRLKLGITIAWLQATTGYQMNLK